MIKMKDKKKPMTGKELLDSGLIGILKDNEEMKDSVAFAKKLANETFSPYTRKGICAECGKSIPLDSEANSEYDFYQHRRYSTMNYKIDYHFCSRICMQKKLRKQPLSNAQVRADTLKMAITHMRVARSSMCLKDRKGMLYAINLLEIKLKELEE